MPLDTSRTLLRAFQMYTHLNYMLPSFFLLQSTIVWVTILSIVLFFFLFFKLVCLICFWFKRWFAILVAVKCVEIFIRTIVHLAISIDIYEQNCTCLQPNWIVDVWVDVPKYVFIALFSQPHIMMLLLLLLIKTSEQYDHSEPIAVANLIHRNLSRFLRFSCDVTISQQTTKMRNCHNLNMVFRRPQLFMSWFFFLVLFFLLHFYGKRVSVSIVYKKIQLWELHLTFHNYDFFFLLKCRIASLTSSCTPKPCYAA